MTTENRLALDTEREVFFYEHEHYYLSNFSAFNLKWRGCVFPTSEHAYHWEKFPHLPVQDDILTAPSAHEALQIARRYKTVVREDWDTVKREIMKDILREKARQHPYVFKKLQQTGKRLLIENSWRDSFWGWGPDRQGLNLMGNLWMEIREELFPARKEPIC